MALEKISQYANEVTELAATDLLDVSKDIGGGNFQTNKAKYQAIIGLTKVSKVFGDFAAAALENDIEIFSLKAGHKIVAIIARHEDLWGDGAVNITDVEVEMGIGGELDKYVFKPHDILQAVGDKIFSDNEINKLEDWNNVTSIRANIRSVGGDLDTLTTGSIDFYIFTKPVKV